jgi:peptidoglycan/xylan/chitin deacetylase (PgdA/CDA1 family)
MRRILAAAWFVLIAAQAQAAECPGNPNALGTSRTLVIDAKEHPRLGAMQYPETLPLADHEVVITFDDGPLPPHTNRILDILASECVKATYFLVGRMAQNFPDVVRHIHNAGHTIGTHSQNHPLTFNKMPIAQAEQQIDGGIASVSAALGDPAALSPFFRIPGLLRANAVEDYLASRSLVTWSAEIVADDWFKRITAKEIVKRALRRIEAKGRGILLLHDIHPTTVQALPVLLHELKARGYRIVHVVPSAPERPKTVTEPQQWASHGAKPVSPRVVSAIDKSFAAPDLQSFGVGPGPKATWALLPALDQLRDAGRTDRVPLPPVRLWPRDARAAITPAESLQAAPASTIFGPPQVATRFVPPQAAAWPLRPTLQTAETRPGTRKTAMKPRTLAKPVRRAPLVTSSLL